FLAPRAWTIERQPPAPQAIARAVELIRAAKRPLIVAGGGAIYSEALGALRALAESTGIPVCETQAGRGALPSDHPLSLGVIGAVNDAAGETGVVVCAAGSMPGDLHKLWRARDPDGKGYHVEYGYSCMGYDIPGGIGVKLAAPEREVYVMVGDGSYLMLPGDLVTAVAEGIKITVVLVDNHGYASIGALSRSLGSAGFGTHYRRPLNGSQPLDA